MCSAPVFRKPSASQKECLPEGSSTWSHQPRPITPGLQPHTPITQALAKSFLLIPIELWASL